MAGKENIRTCLFCGCGGWAAFLYDRTDPKIGAAFPDSPVRLWIAAYAKLAPVGAQTSNAVIASAVRIRESLARSYYRYFLFFLRFFMYISYRSNI